MPWTFRGWEHVVAGIARRLNEGTYKTLPPVSVTTAPRFDGRVQETVRGSRKAVTAYVKNWLHDNEYVRDGRLVSRSDDGTEAVLERWWRM